MATDTNKHRRSIRLKGYDYAQAGAYFVTIVVQGRQRLFGEVTGGVMQLNDAGLMVQDSWNELQKYYPGVEAEAFECRIISMESLTWSGQTPMPSRVQKGNHGGWPLHETQP